MRSQSSTTCGLSAEEHLAAWAAGKRPWGASEATAAPATVPRVRERRLSTMRASSGRRFGQAVHHDDTRVTRCVPSAARRIGDRAPLLVGDGEVTLGDEL